MALTDYPKHDRSRDAQAASSDLARHKAAIEAAELRIKAAQDPHGDFERNRRAERAERRKEAEAFLLKLAPMRERYERALKAAPLHTRQAYLRKHALSAEPGAIALLAAMPEAALVQLVEEAAARGDKAIVGAVHALGRSFADPASSRRVSEATESVELPEQVEAEAQLKAIRDAYLECEALYKGLSSPEAGARERLNASHRTAAPAITMR